MKSSGIESPAIPSGKLRPYKVLVTASVIVPLVLFAVIMWQDYRIEFQATEQEVLRTTEIFQQHALNVFETHQLVAERVSDRLRGMSWDEIERSGAIGTYLVKICNEYPQVQLISLADASGVVRNASLPRSASPVRVDDRDYFRALREADVGMFVGHIVAGRVMKSLNFSVARRREGKTGVFDGVVIITVTPDYFSQFWNKVTRHSDFGAALVRSDGVHLARAPFLNPDVLSSSPSSSLAQAIRRGEQGPYVGVSTTDATKRVYAVRRVGNYNVYMVYGIGTKVILQAWRKDLVFYGCFFGAATMALLLLALVALKRTEEELKVYRQGLEALVEQRAEALMAVNKQLMQVSAYNRRLIESSLDPLVTIDASGKITDVNRATENVTGYPRDHLIGKDCWDFLSDPARARAGIEQVLREGSVQDYALEIRHRNGTVTPVLFNASVYRDDSGELLGVFAAARDITELKRVEERMRDAQKFESLGILAGGIAHDFNNLLMGIMGHADLALAELSPGSPVREHLEQVEKASQRAADLCRQMLAYSGKGRFVVESLDLGVVVKEIADRLAMSISKKAILQYRIPPDLPRIEADASQIRQVVMNLIINASEAIGDNPGEISLTTGAADCDRAYLRDIGAGDELPEGRYVFLEVADSGSGMDKERQQKIFDPFFSTKFTGRGLGLAAVLGIVRGHRGAIKVYSEMGKGSMFKVLLPATGMAATSVTGPKLPKEAWKVTGTVLLVDDEETVRQVGVGMLESLGFRTLTAQDGQEALEVFAAHRDEIVCVLLDLTMPRLGGEEAFREIRRLDPDARVILTSGYNEQQVSRLFVGEGLAGFLQKPYKADTLAAMLRKVLEG